MASCESCKLSENQDLAIYNETGIQYIAYNKSWFSYMLSVSNYNFVNCCHILTELSSLQGIVITSKVSTVKGSPFENLADTYISNSVIKFLFYLNNIEIHFIITINWDALRYALQ